MTDTLERAFIRGCNARLCGGGTMLVNPYSAASEHAKRYRVGWYSADAMLATDEEEIQAVAEVLL